MSQGRPTAAQQEAARGTWVMGTPVPPYGPPPAGWSVADYGFPASGAPPPSYSASNNRAGNPYLDISAAPIGAQAGGNPYVNVSPVPNKSPTETILKVLGRCGKKLEDTSRKAGGAAGHVWQHLKTSPSLTDAALARITQGTKVLAEGGNDKVFQQTFNTYPGEQLWKSYACYISTSAGPVIGTLYLSTARIAFCSDNPVSYSTTPGQQETTNYKIIVPLDHLRAVNPSANTRDPSDKYIQILTIDNHEFWFMGFISYDKALKNLRGALQFSPHSSNF